MPNVYWLYTAKYPAFAVALTLLSASKMRRVYVSVSSGRVAVDWYAPVSQNILPVSSVDWLRVRVYVPWLAVQVASTSIAVGVTDREV